MWALHRTRKLKKKGNARRAEDNFLLHKAKAQMLASQKVGIRMERFFVLASQVEEFSIRLGYALCYLST
jgi:hypothetical protein